MMQIILIPKKKKLTSSMIDQLLDEYNDYLTLYSMFGDPKYSVRAVDIMIFLKLYSK